MKTWQKRRRTKKGLIGIIYSQQKSSSKKRLHNPPSYTKEWLSLWLLNNPDFHRLYDIWVMSGYEKNYKPSIDRINDDLPYSEYNIQLMTWKENNHKGHADRRDGKSSQGKLCSPISQYDLDGNFIAEYHSISEAARKTNINNISKVCRGKAIAAGGFTWRYKTCKPDLKELK